HDRGGDCRARVRIALARGGASRDYVESTLINPHPHPSSSHRNTSRVRKRVLIAACIVLLLIVLQLLMPQLNWYGAEVVSVRVQVIDAASGAAIPRASVVVVNQEDLEINM